MKWKLVCCTLFFLFSSISAIAEQLLPPAEAIASASPLATKAGIEILQKGGNAFDAAVAVTATLGVVEPYSSGLGGGGFWLLHIAKENKNIVIDGREKAPLKAHRDMYLDKQKNVIPEASLNGPLSAAIPGTPAAIIYLQKHYGKLPLLEDLKPAINYAEYGFRVTKLYQKQVKFRYSILMKYPSTQHIFLPNQGIPKIGSLIIQKDLAQTLRDIAAHGRGGFYAGPVADKMVKAVQEHGGIWDLRDLQFYQVVIRNPLIGHYLGVKIITVPPPSSGGVALLTMLNILSGYNLDKLSMAMRLHLIIEAMRLAYWDRARFMGDPDFVDVPVTKLLSVEHTMKLRSLIKMNQATPSNELSKGLTFKEGNDTTHFSILDKEGNIVSATVTINYPFGSGFVAAGTGVLLNDEMDDFTAKPGTPNVYGLINYGANAIEPRKKPVSSMTPTILIGPNGVGILGTPGGSRIITTVLRGLLLYVKGEKPEQWVSAKRFHMQYLPDEIMFEAGAFSKEIKAQLLKMGYHFNEVEPFCNMQAILWDTNNHKVFAASDPRGEGLAEVVKIKKDKDEK